MTTALASPSSSSAARSWGALLLDAGVLAPVVYVAADITCSMAYPGYSMTSQVISELSAVGAPTVGLWGAFMVPFSVLFTAFAMAALLASRGNPALRQTGWLLIVFVLSGPLWAFAPMHQRGEPFTSSDARHVALGAFSVTLSSAIVATGALALGRRFRLYSWLTLAAILAAGAATFYYVGPMTLGQPSSMAGLVERVSLHGFWLWLAIFSLALRRDHQSRAPQVSMSHGS